MMPCYHASKMFIWTEINSNVESCLSIYLIMFIFSSKAGSSGEGCGSQDGGCEYKCLTLRPETDGLRE